ncbi:MAG: AtpZ/AtpI family protein [Acidobacteriota bacterium]
MNKTRQKPGSEGPDTGNGGNAEFWRLMTRYLPAISLLPASVVAGYAMGYGLDYVFSTTFLRLVFMILGVVSAVVQLIRILGSDTK